MATSIGATAQEGWFGHMDGWGWGMAIFGWLFMALIVLLVAWFVWSIARQTNPPASRRESSARALLDERYAKGEIERDEYLAKRADLEG